MFPNTTVCISPTIQMIQSQQFPFNALVHKSCRTFYRNLDDNMIACG